VAFYLLYPAGLVFLALSTGPQSLSEAAVRCAVVGLVAYGTYDMTNLSTLKGWGVGLSLLDTAWGAIVSTVAGTLAWWVAAGRR
jgi:uncharacterized membrane protein